MKRLTSEDLRLVLDAARQHHRDEQHWRPVNGPAYVESNLKRAENRNKLGEAIDRLEESCPEIMARHITDQELLGKIKNTSKDDNKGFREIISLVIDDLYVDASEIRHEFGIGKGTLSRWKFGHSAPYSTVRSYLFSWLAKKVQDQIDYRERNKGPIFFDTNCGPDD